jgi:hypothetical protein
VWVGRNCEEVIGPDGSVTRIRRSEILGSVAEVPTQPQAEQLLAERLRRFNSPDYRPASSLTFGENVERCWLPQVLPTLKHFNKQVLPVPVEGPFVPCFENMQLRLITCDAVRQVVADKLRVVSWSTAKGMRTLLGGVMTSLKRMI